MLVEFLYGYAVVFVHLQALYEEQACLDAYWLIEGQFVASIVDLGNQVLHLVGVEGSHTHEHLV